MTMMPHDPAVDGSPDAPEYVNLDLLDYGGEADLLGAALARLQASLPEWEPRVGTTEMLLLESLAMMLGVEVMALQMVPAQVTEQIMRLYGVSRDPGRGATGQVRITVTESRPLHAVPRGTRFRWKIEETDEAFDLLTTETVEVVTSNGLDGVAGVIGDLVGDELNGLPEGTVLEVVDNLPFIENVEVSQALSGGAGEEPDQVFFSRASAVLSTLNSTLVMPEDFQNAALTVPGVGRARVINNYDPTLPEGDGLGHVAVAVADQDGEPVTEELQQQVLVHLLDSSLASLTLHVIDPTYTTVNVTVSVTAASGYDASDVEAAVQATLAQWLSPSTWDWSEQVVNNQIVVTVGSLPQVAMVNSVSGGRSLPGVAPLARLGTVNVTVVTP